jgi:hypothetical protein
MSSWHHLKCISSMQFWYSDIVQLSCCGGLRSRFCGLVSYALRSSDTVICWSDWHLCLGDHELTKSGLMLPFNV